MRIPDSRQRRWIHETERLIITFCIVVTFVSMLSAQTKPNFSGHWKLNSLESDFGVLPTPASRTDTIEHNEPSLKISTDQMGSQGTQSDVVYYVTDGQDSMNKMGMLDVRSKVSWQGNNLVVASIVYLEDGLMNSDSIWTLSDNGTTMTQRTHLMIASREIEQKLVFDRTGDPGSPAASVAKKVLAPTVAPVQVNYSGIWRPKVLLFFFVCQPTIKRQLRTIPRSTKDASSRIRSEFVGARVAGLLALRASTLFASYYCHP